jgi:AraC-like DNA-binding protein
MSPNRHLDVTVADVPVIGSAEMFAPGILPSHIHKDRAQLLYVARGILNVATPTGRWILPAGRALWIAPAAEHGLDMPRPIALSVLFLNPAFPGLPDWRGCKVVNVTPLLRELITLSLTWPLAYAPNSAEGRMARVLVDQLAVMDQAPVDLPEPRDPRAVRMAQLAREDVADRRPLSVLAPLAGASPRTVERLFAAETGMSFGAWKQRHRLIVALERLANGEGVAAAGYAVGYESPSSFIAAFKGVFAKTPGRYFEPD